MFLKGKEILSYSYMYRNNEATYKMLIYELFAIASPDLSGRGNLPGLLRRLRLLATTGGNGDCGACSERKRRILFLAMTGGSKEGTMLKRGTTYLAYVLL